MHRYILKIKRTTNNPYSQEINLIKWETMKWM